MDKNQPLRSDLIEAWNRLVEHTCTSEDLTLLLDSLKSDDHLQEFDEVYNRVRNNAITNKPRLTKRQKEAYRREAYQLIAKYERKRGMVSSPTIARFRKIWYAAAAAILLGLLIPATYLYMKPKTEQTTVQYVEMDTQRGEIKTIFLPDQTEVTLNAGSRIKYPANFTGCERSVELYGEAIFNVTSDPAHPFTVKTENMNIKVVGTVFDVKEYADDLTASVSVASGKVEVNLLETGRAASIMLEQNRQVKMDKATGNIETMSIDADTYLSWTIGALYFERTPIREVVNVLNRHFPQVDIEMADGEYYYLITGKYNNVKHPDNIIKGIAYTLKLKYKKTGNKYVLYNE